MADKPEFVDTISQATRQRWRRSTVRAAEPGAVKEERSRLSHWPPKKMLQWRLENLTPWKLRGWRDDS